jgi:hypothetical protein
MDVEAIFLSVSKGMGRINYDAFMRALDEIAARKKVGCTGRLKLPDSSFQSWGCALSCCGLLAQVSAEALFHRIAEADPMASATKPQYVRHFDDKVQLQSCLPDAPPAAGVHGAPRELHNATIALQLAVGAPPCRSPPTRACTRGADRATSLARIEAPAPSLGHSRRRSGARRRHCVILARAGTGAEGGCAQGGGGGYVACMPGCSRF